MDAAVAQPAPQPQLLLSTLATVTSGLEELAALEVRRVVLGASSSVRLHASAGSAADARCTAAWPAVPASASDMGIDASTVQVHEGHLRFYTALPQALPQLSELTIVGNVWAVAAERKGLLSGVESGAEQDLAALASFAAEAGWGSGGGLDAAAERGDGGSSWVAALLAWAQFAPAARVAGMVCQLRAAGVVAEDLDAVLRGRGASSGGTPLLGAAPAAAGEGGGETGGGVGRQVGAFRVKCKRAGSATGHTGAKEHGFTSHQAAAAVGGAIRARWGWGAWCLAGSRRARWWRWTGGCRCPRGKGPSGES